MNYLLDTNILVYYITKPQLLIDFENQYQPFSNKNVALISIVTEGEMKSLAIQRGWGQKKLKKLDDLISQFLKVPLNTNRQIKVYSEIDAYSKHKDPVKKYPKGYSS
ncbi:MAG: hypothetical protein WD607_04080, partial [Candidatus Paceibacterota bacterium]